MDILEELILERIEEPLRSKLESYDNPKPDIIEIDSTIDDKVREIIEKLLDLVM